MAQDYTDDVFAGSHVGQTDLQNMENNFGCIKSSFSGASAPPSPIAGMLWLDTTNNIFKLRNSANSAWIDIVDTSANAVIAVDAVNEDSILDAAVTVDKLATDAVATAKIVNLAVTNAKIADDTILEGKLGFNLHGTNVAGAMGVHYNAANSDTASFTPAKVKELTLGPAGTGTLTITFTLTAISGSLGAQAQIYRNDSPVGTLRSTSGATFSESIAGWSETDALQIYAYTTIAGSARVSNMILSLHSDIYAVTVL